MAGNNGRERVPFLCVLSSLSQCLHCLSRLSDERLQGPQSINLTRADQTKPGPKSGAAQLEWNKSGSLLLVRFGEQSNLLNDFPRQHLPPPPRKRPNCGSHFRLPILQSTFRPKITYRPSAHPPYPTRSVESRAQRKLGYLLRRA